MTDEKSVVHSKGVDKRGFVYSMSARADSLEDAMADIQYRITTDELEPWQDSRNQAGREPEKPTNLVEDAKDLGGVRNLGKKNYQPKVGEVQIGDAYEILASLYSYDTEHIRFYSRTKKVVDGAEQVTISKYPVCNISMKEGGIGLADFTTVFPDFTPEMGSKQELPMGVQYLYIVVGPNLNSNQNPYHNLKGTRDA